MVAAVCTFQLQTFCPNKTENNKKSRKCKKQGIKNFLFLYYIQAKCCNITNKNPNAADDTEQTFNYRWPNLGTLDNYDNVLIKFIIQVFLWKCDIRLTDTTRESNSDIQKI